MENLAVFVLLEVEVDAQSLLHMFLKNVVALVAKALVARLAEIYGIDELHLTTALL